MFGKFFASTFTGSMVGAGANVFAVWGYIIANADKDGFVELNPTLVAAAIGAPVEAVNAAIEYLMAADPNSRSKKEDGRRLVKQSAYMYLIPTYADYRAIRDYDGRKAYMREYMRDYRANKNKDLGAVKANVNIGKPQLAHTEAEAEAEAEKRASDANASLVDAGASTRPPPREDQTPYAHIIDLYHGCLPSLPRIIKRTKTRDGLIRQRWLQDLKSLDRWRRFFVYVSQSAFLMGRSAPANGRPPFVADLEWLTRPGNFAKIVEGKYHHDV